MTMLSPIYEITRSTTAYTLRVLDKKLYLFLSDW